MKNYLKIGLYGDSLSLSRPDFVNMEERYFYKIINYYQTQFPGTIVETIQRSKASITSTEIADIIHHDNVYFNWPGETCIIHLGIVDCAPRPINNSLREKISKWPSALKKIAISFLHNNRRKILLKGNVHFVTPINVFEANLKRILSSSLEKYKKIIVITICPTNSDFEFKSPGLSNAIEQYNEVIRKQINLLQKDKIKLVDINKIILDKKESLDDYIVKQDGHHITPKTHQIIFNKIIEAI